MDSNLKEEFVELITQYQGILHKVCLIYFQDEDDRKDNFQEIVYQLWRSYPKLHKKESIGSWIYKISINTSIAKIRKDSKYINPEKFPDVIDSYDFFEDWTKNEHVNLLIAAIRSLNDIDKSIMFLYLEERSHQEISNIIGISVSNVGTKINRIKSQLKETLNQINYGK